MLILSSKENYNLGDSNFKINLADEILNFEFYENEIVSAIHGLQSGKSFVFDGILNEHIKSSKDLLMPHLY